MRMVEDGDIVMTDIVAFVAGVAGVADVADVADVAICYVHICYLQQNNENFDLSELSSC